MLRENLDAGNSAIGLKTKILTGIVFANRIYSPELIKVVETIGLHFGLTEDDFKKVTQYVQDDHIDQISDDPKLTASMVLVKAVSPSPAEISEDVVRICRESELTPPQIVELIAWISVLQMLYRLKSFYPPATLGQ